MPKVIDGKLIRGPRIGFHEAYDLSAKYEVKHVVDLEAGYCTLWGICPDDEKKNSEFFGMKYHAMPLGAFIPPSEDECRKILAFIYEARDRIYIHCHSGVDRTGFIVALYGVLRYGRCPHDEWVRAREEGMHLRYYWFWKKTFFERCKELREDFGWAD